MDPRDSACIARCLDGHPEEYRFLVERYERVLVSWLTGRLRNRLAAEEVAQEAFVRAWFALGRARTGRPSFPWVLAIAAMAHRKMSTYRRDRRTNEGHHGGRRSSFWLYSWP